MMRGPLRRFKVAMLVAAAIAPPLGGVGYVLYSVLLANQTTQQLTLPYDGFYWDGAQFQIAYGRFANQILLYRSGIDADTDEIQLRFEVLESKLAIVTASTAMLSDGGTLRSRQQEILRQLDAALESIDPDIDLLSRDPGRTLKIIGVLRQNQDAVNELANGRRVVDVAERDYIARDFVSKRRYLFAAGMLLALLSMVATAMLLLNGYRRSRLIHQQRAALEAQHQATRAARGIRRD